MDLAFDPAKRDANLQRRNLDFARAREVFAGPHFTRIDARQDYGEDRYITVGHLDDRFVVLTWTPRDSACRIISMRYGHDREFQRYRNRLG